MEKSYIFKIKGRTRLIDVQLASLTDFDLEKGESIEPAAILSDPCITLYCLDFKNEKAVFVKTPSHINIGAHPFFYQAQYKNAEYVIVIPYETFHQLANQLPDPRHLDLIYSVGRCGSTLLSQAFKELPQAFCLSEPDVYAQIVKLRYKPNINRSQLLDLLRSCTRLLFKPNPSHPRLEATHMVVKFRSMSIELADLLYELYPKARVLFLYRNAEDTIKSFLSIMGPTGSHNWGRKGKLRFKLYVALLKLTMNFKTDLFDLMPIIQYYPRDMISELGPLSVPMALWLTGIKRFFDLKRNNMEILTVRYEDFKINYQTILSKIFSYCGLDVSEKLLNDASKIFLSDSQKETSLAQGVLQKRDLSSHELNLIKEFLSKDPEVLVGDVVLPGGIRS